MNALQHKNLSFVWWGWHRVVAAVFTVVMAVGAFVDAPAYAAAEPVRNVSFDIPAQSMATALLRFSEQTGFQVTAQGETLQVLDTAGVRGEYRVTEALGILLKGSGLTYKFVDEETVVVRGEGERVSSLAGKRMVQAAGDSPSVQGEGQSEDQQGSSDSSASSEAEKNKISEIIVTARKVSERLQDVPISVTAISGAELERLGATDMKDVLRTVPGLTYFGQDRSKSVYTIRGVASGLTTTGVYLDDISLLNTGLEGGGGVADPVFFDMERLEVLKGPQGTLYGGSAMGGAIKYISARPDPSRFSGSGAIGTASTAQGGAPSYNAEAVVNLPIISDVLAVRGGIYFNHEGGYIDNLPNLAIENPARSSTPFPVYTPVVDPSLSEVTEKDYNSADTRAGRLSLLWQPGSSLSIRPALFYQDYRLDNPSDFLANEEALVSSYRFTNQEQRDRLALYSLEINKGWSGAELTSLTGYFDRKFVGDRDYSFFVNRIIGLPFATDSFAHYGNTTKTFSQELRLSSPSSSDGPLTWVGGLYYSQRKIHATPQVKVFSPIFPGLLLDGNRRTDVEETAAFGEASYEIIEGLRFTAGVRLFKIEQTAIVRDQGLAGSAPSDLESSEDGINPKFGISYNVNRDHLLFASAAKGFRQGGPLPVSFTDTCAADFPALGLSGPPSSYKSDNLWTYEVGSKNTLGGNRVVLNGAVFQTNWKEIQQTVRLPTCGQTFTANAGEARIRGAELEAKFNIGRAFQIGGSATYLDAQITDPGAFSTTFHDGDDLQFTSKWMTNAYSTYSMPLGAVWELEIRGDYQYRSDARLQYSDVQRVVYSDGVVGFVPNAAERNPSYDVANVSLSLDNGRTNLRLFVNNIFDDRPVLDYDSIVLLHTRASTLRPRTVGLELRQQF